MAGEAVASLMRLATAPGRLARPAPPGNDDPCDEGARSRRVCRGCPERPPQRGFRRVVPMPATASAKVGKGQRRARARARNPTWSAVKASVSRRRDTQDVSPQIELRSSMCGISNAATGQPAVRNERKAGSAQACGSMRRPPAGHGGPIGVRRKHPSATGAPHAPREGAAKGRSE